MKTVCRHAKLALLVAVILAGGLYVYARSRSASYESTAVVSFAPKPNVPIDVPIVRQQVARYAAYVVGNSAAERVTVSSPPETANLEITAQDGSARTAARIAQKAAEQVVAFAGRTDRLVDALVVVPAAPAASPRSDRTVVAAVVLVLAVFCGIAAALLVDRLIIRSAADPSSP